VSVETGWWLQKETVISIKFFGLGETNGQVRLQAIGLSLQQFYILLSKENICNL
jgi:hypothetical protein